MQTSPAEKIDLLGELRKKMAELDAMTPEQLAAWKAKLKTENAALRAAERTVAARTGSIAASGMPEALQAATLETLEEHDLNAKALEAARAWRDSAVHNVAQGRGLLLIGPPGVGKTHIVAALARAAVERMLRPITVRFWNWAHFVVEGNRDWRRRDPGMTLEMAVTADVLILDELGCATGRGDWAGESNDLLLTLLDKRLYAKRRGAVLATTNKLPEELEAAIGGRQFSRLKALAGQPIVVAGKDYRG